MGYSFPAALVCVVAMAGEPAGEGRVQWSRWAFEFGTVLVIVATVRLMWIFNRLMDVKHRDATDESGRPAAIVAQTGTPTGRASAPPS